MGAPPLLVRRKAETSTTIKRCTTGFGLQQDGTSATNQPLALAHAFRYTSSINGELHKQLNQRSN